MPAQTYHQIDMALDSDRSAGFFGGSGLLFRRGENFSDSTFSGISSVFPRWAPTECLLLRSLTGAVPAAGAPHPDTAVNGRYWQIRRTVSGRLLPEDEFSVQCAGASGIAQNESRSTSPPQKIDRPVYVVNHSNANVPASEFPLASSPGAHTHTAISPGSTATIPPPTPLFAGSPTRYTKSPAAS